MNRFLFRSKICKIYFTAATKVNFAVYCRSGFFFCGNNSAFATTKSGFSILFVFQFILFVESLRSGKFHQQLTQIFAPLVVRYVDLMEASIAQSIGVPDSPTRGAGGTGGTGNCSSREESGGAAGFAAAALSNVGALSNMGSFVSAAAAGAANAASAASRAGGLMAAATAAASAASAAATSGQNAFSPTPVTSAELLWKLEALQSFIRELHWPDSVFAEHLDNRLKMMAADMIDSAAQR